MGKIRRVQISLANPFVVPLAFISLGGLGLIGYLFIYEQSCENNSFLIGFLLSVAFISVLVWRWAKMLESVNHFTVSKIPTPLVLLLGSLNIYIALTLVIYPDAIEVDSRLDAYGSSVMIMFNTVVSALFFPICFFASKTKALSKFVFLVFVSTTAVTLFVNPSKSAIIGLFFTILFYYFIHHKSEGRHFQVSLTSIKSMFLILAAAVGQLALLVVVYGNDFMFQLGLVLYRIANNFDAAIYGCMIRDGINSPENFLTYSFLPLIKRIDSSFYSLDFFNVPQWLIYEALGISREGRTGFPNDNLFVGLYFGGFGLWSALVFISIIYFAHFFFSKKITEIQRTHAVDPLILVLLVKLPMLYQSTQEFIGLLLIITLLRFFSFFYQLVFRKLAQPSRSFFNIVRLN
jgi:hypothetical protein